MKNHRFGRYCLVFSMILMGVMLFYSLSEFEFLYAQTEDVPCPKPYVKTLSPQAAKPGEEIKIRGSRFGKEQGMVTFTPGVKASIREWTFKRVFVIVPEGARTGPVFLTARCGEESNEVHCVIKPKEQ